MKVTGRQPTIAEQLAAAMEEQGLTKVEMAARMKTSRRQLDRLLDRAIPSIRLICQKFAVRFMTHLAGRAPRNSVDRLLTSSDA